MLQQRPMPLAARRWRASGRRATSVGRRHPPVNSVSAPPPSSTELLLYSLHCLGLLLLHLGILLGEERAACEGCGTPRRQPNQAACCALAARDPAVRSGGVPACGSCARVHRPRLTANSASATGSAQRAQRSRLSAAAFAAHLWVDLELGHDENGEEHEGRHHALQPGTHRDVGRGSRWAGPFTATAWPWPPQRPRRPGKRAHVGRLQEGNDVEPLPLLQAGGKAGPMARAQRCAHLAPGEAAPSKHHCWGCYRDLAACNPNLSSTTASSSPGRTSKYSICATGRSSSGYGSAGCCGGGRRGQVLLGMRFAAPFAACRHTRGVRSACCPRQRAAPQQQGRLAHPRHVHGSGGDLALAGGSHIQLGGRVDQGWVLHPQGVHAQRHAAKREGAVGQRKGHQAAPALQLQPDLGVCQGGALCSAGGAGAARLAEAATAAAAAVLGAGSGSRFAALGGLRSAHPAPPPPCRPPAATAASPRRWPAAPAAPGGAPVRVASCGDREDCTGCLHSPACASCCSWGPCCSLTSPSAPITILQRSVKQLQNLGS